ncbi:hypothetical protein QJS66_00045 [Kocuria rhizophila]|nr:hypothetical protein QJS66_00045 [Kocuria rhizophila]
MTSVITAVGLQFLSSCAASPCRRVSRRSARRPRTTGGQPLHERGWVMTIVGFGTLFVGGILTIVGVSCGAPRRPSRWRRTRCSRSSTAPSGRRPVRPARAEPELQDPRAAARSALRGAAGPDRTTGRT